MLRITNLVKRYGPGRPAVDGVSLNVAPGDICGFIGRNGAGKTTTIRSVVGALPFDEGEIVIDGASVRTDSMHTKEVTAYVPDDPELYGFLTGEQYIRFVMDMWRVPEKERGRAGELAERFSLTNDLPTLISAYSHGMKQKLAIIAALSHRPKLLVLDEPFVGLDPIAAHTFKELMGELCREGGAVFFSTHVLETAEKLCNRVAVIRQGRIVASGDIDRVRGDQSLEDVFLELTEHDA